MSTATWNTSTIDVSNAGHVPRLLYSREQAAFLLSICTRTLDGLLLTKKIKRVKIGRSVRVPGDEIQRFIRTHVN